MKNIEIVGGVVLENSEGKILLTKSLKWLNKWMMPGGHIEYGEKIMDGLVRETKEETGVKNLEVVGIVSYGELINSKDFHRPAHFIYFDVYCKTKESKIRLDNKELTEYEWFYPEEALKLNLVDTYEKTIKDYLEFKKKLLK